MLRINGYGELPYRMPSFLLSQGWIRKTRKKMILKVTDAVEDYKKSKLKIYTKISTHVQEKP